MKFKLLFVLLLSIPVFLKAQVVVNQSFNAEYLVNEILLGGGISAENITINGQLGSTVNTQFGYFEANQSNLGIRRGIILATGGVSVAESPNDLPTAHVAISPELELTSDPDLEQIIGPADLNDVAVLEFDFTAVGDTLRLRYVFASEEYNEHTCSVYNDAFGFFISGPGIQGTFSGNSKNIALIPNTNVPVKINTVNQGFAGAFGANSVCNASSANWQANSVYFVNNEANTHPNAAQFDGFTVPMLVEIPVSCGGQYHIKFAIADAVDGKNDSAVFFEAGSFESTAPLQVETEIVHPGQNGEALEGCSGLKIKMVRPDSLGQKKVSLRAINLANSSSILSDLPEIVTFYHLQNEVEITIPIHNDHAFSGLRNFQLAVIQAGVCGQDSTYIYMPISIDDRENLTVDYIGSHSLNCIETAIIQVNVIGGYPPYQIDWSDPTYTGFNFSLNPLGNLEIDAQITDLCGANTDSISIDIDRETYNPLTVVLPNAVQYNCFDPIELFALTTGGEGTYSYTWSYNDEVISQTAELSHLFQSNGDLTVTVSDLCVESVSVTIPVEAMSSPLILNLGEDVNGICTDPVQLTPEISGGFGNISYIWRLNSNAVSSSPTYSFTPMQTCYVSLEVTDQCGQAAFDQKWIYLENLPLSIIVPSDTVICKGERLVYQAQPTGGFGEYQYTWNGQNSLDGMLSLFPGSNATYTVVVEDQCGSSAEASIRVKKSEVEARFEFALEDPVHPIINLSTNESACFWQFPDGSMSDNCSPMVETASLLDGPTTLTVQDEYGCEDQYSLIYEPLFRIFIPTAFTPDGDGLNDIFKAEGQFVEEFELMIFDHWGKLVFQTKDIEVGWKGDSDRHDNYSGEAAVYSYRYIAKSVDGLMDEGIGVVHLLR